MSVQKNSASRLAGLLSVSILLGPTSASAQSTAAVKTAIAPAPFRFVTDAFWLNLHQFLYVLGRAVNKTTDSSRSAVAGAPADEARGVSVMTPLERETWGAAVAFYANGPSKLDAVFDPPLISTGQVLSRWNSNTLDGAAIPVETRDALTRVADIYRRMFWPAHRAGNEAWVKDVTPLLSKHGASILAYITRAYDAPWPQGGYVAYVTAYTNWAGAFSTDGGLLVLSSLSPDLHGSQALEIVFHESMHQWDEITFEALLRAAKSQGVRFDNRLSHAMMFFTAGEATRSAIEGHVPYAEGGVWARGMEPLRPALAATWKPWLDGKVTREEALKNLVVKAAPAAR